MGDDDDVVVIEAVREDHFLPVRNGTGDGVLEALGAGNVAVGDTGVTGIELGVAGIVLREGQRGDIVAAAPDLDLGVAVLLGGLGLVEALEVAVVLLIETPALLDGNPVEVHVVEDVVEGLDGSLEVGSVSLREGEALGLEELAGFLGFGLAFRGQVDIGPAGETVFEIPGAFAMTYEYDSFHNIFSVLRFLRRKFTKKIRIRENPGASIRPHRAPCRARGPRAAAGKRRKRPAGRRRCRRLR